MQFETKRILSPLNYKKNVFSPTGGTLALGGGGGGGGYNSPT